MAHFSYKAKTGPKHVLTGVVEADNLDKAVDKIIAFGYTPLEVKPSSGQPVAASSAIIIDDKGVLPSNIPPAVISVFIRELGDLLQAQIPVVRTLDLLGRQTKHPFLRSIIEKMKLFVQDGGSLSGALNQHPSVFSNLQVQMVKCGETSGQLAEVLLHLADLMDNHIELQKRIQMGLTYPFIILGVGVLTIAVLLTVVLPKLTVIFDDFNATLPVATQIVIAVSHFMASFWWVMVLTLTIGGYYGYVWYTSATGRAIVDQKLLDVPFLRHFITTAQTARFARALATLLTNGVAVANALESSVALIDNAVLKEEMKKASAKVRAGTSVSNALKGSVLFGDVAVSLVAVAEEGGHLDQGLFKLAVMCEREVRQKADLLVSIMGPAVLVIVVGFVGMIVVAILLPMLQMNMIIN